jgi:hypothetical protein
MFPASGLEKNVIFRPPGSDAQELLQDFLNQYSGGPKDAGR